MRYGKLGLILTAAVLMTAVSVTSFAQAQPGGQGGRQGRGQGGGQRAPQMTVASIPAAVLASELGLSAEQKTKVGDILKKLETDLKPLTPAPGEQVDRQTRQEQRQKSQELRTQATKDIEAVLTEEQKNKLPDVMKGLQSFTSVGIPVGVIGDLKLTDEEKTKIAKIAKDAQAAQQASFQDIQAARQSGDQAKMQELLQASQKARTETHDKAVAVLTDDQKKLLEKYLKDHPQPAFGQGRRPGGGAPPPPSR